MTAQIKGITLLLIITVFMYGGVHMLGHTCRDQGTTVWGVYMPKHTLRGQRTTMWGTYIPRHTLRRQRTTGSVGYAHSRAHMQYRDYCVGCAHTKAHTEGSGYL